MPSLLGKSLLLVSLLVATAGQQTTCGWGTYLNSGSDECLCSGDAPDLDDMKLIQLAGIFDTTTYDWGKDIFDTTVRLINDRHWNILPEGYRLEYELEDAMCDESKAMQAYWKLRTSNGNRPMHGIVGARCSGASMALARIAGLEGVPQVSPSSNSAALSNDEEFPYFSRLMAPNDENGEVGAMVAMLRSFGWERIGIITADTQFAKDFTTAFRKSWVGKHKDWLGQVAYSDTVRINPDGSVDEESILQVLDNIPTDPLVSSRVILLAAHSEHAFPLLEIAKRQNFQPDTIWVGPSAWVGKDINPNDYAWLPETPGYIGVTPFQNRDDLYDDFMSELQAFQRARGKEPLQQLPTFAAETVDAIGALTAAIASASDKRDGAEIVRLLRARSFQGVSGLVEFDEKGDRKNPIYSMFNLQPSSTNGGEMTWTEVGVTGTTVNSSSFFGTWCFAGLGCGLTSPPEDTYPLPPYRLPVWAIFLILFLLLVFMALIGVSFKYRSSRRSKQNIKAELQTFRESVVGLRTAECKYIPHTSKRFNDVEQAQDVTALWMWKETQFNMNRHKPDTIYGDPNECWILYTPDCTLKLEDAFQKGKKKFQPLPGYSVDLAKFEQTKIATGYTRAVQRMMAKPATKDYDQSVKDIDMTEVTIGDPIPDDLKDEPRIVLVEKDILQISNQRSDGWAFGTKIHHIDEATARKLVAVATNGAKDDNVFVDSGWFQLDKTRVPTPDDLAVVQQNVGDTSALDPPAYWDKIKDANIVQKHELNPGDKERLEVENAFMSTLNPSKVQVLKVERIQNLAMWQSYVVKRQTVCSRETGQNADDSTQQKALKRFERRWLFHGSNFEVVDKILQQGFNRSFCGKNATMYGKGVYFARDAKYSSARLYSVPDWQGRQYIMACRVVVGEFCRGKTDALTPDIRCNKSHSLYDCTVDSTNDPSIYVTYHDAQAYPEYLITFKQN